MKKGQVIGSLIPHRGSLTKKRLPALTSLRFFAAALVVYLHTQTYLQLPSLAWLDVYSQGVSIFFVLSGFILTYVYPKLDSWNARKRFFRARFARIWPVYLLSIALAIIVYPKTTLDTSTYFAWLTINILALQSWVPVGVIFSSINGPSWSVSTEVFFYAVFPLLILSFARTWWLKLIGTFSIVVCLIIAIIHFNIPGLGPGLYSSLTYYGLLYIDPYARLFEFVCGMCAALLYQKISLFYRVGELYATGIEISSLYLLMFNGIIASAIFQCFPFLKTVPSFFWLGMAGGSAIPTAILITLLASNRGILAKLMSAPWLVMLGELSYSIYLMHYPLLQFFTRNIPCVADEMSWFTISLYLSALFLLTHLIWTLIENPCREMLMGIKSYHVSSMGYGILNPSWKTALIEGALLFFVLIFVFLRGAMPGSLSPNAISAIQQTPAEIRGAQFGSLAKLEGYFFVQRSEGATLHLIWEAQGAIDKNTSVAIHMLSEPGGSIISQGDYIGKLISTQDKQLFEDAIVLTNQQLANACYVGIGLYVTGTGNLLAVDKGPTDWNGHRLLISVPSTLNSQCASNTM